jgi:Spy/CpxP family protein refolding chaperone
MKRTFAIAVVVAAVLCATAAWSQGPPGPGGPGGPGGMRGHMMSCPAMAVAPPPPMMLDRMSNILQLTDDQRTQIMDLIGKSDKTVRPLMQKAGDATKALHMALLAADFNAQTVKDLAAMAERAEADVVGANIDVWAQIRGVLTKDQATGLQEALAGPPQGPGPGGPPPPGGPDGPPPPPGQ